MSAPHGFYWLESPFVAGMARPTSIEELLWLRREGIELLITLTEDPLPRSWVNEAGLLVMHSPIPDMGEPSPEEIDRCISAMERAIGRNMGVAIHCEAGKGRTGTLLACYLVTRGLSAENAIGRIRRLRPGSIETAEQADAVGEFSRRHGKTGNPD
jgi:atypical dual specificity phosphatase